MAQALPAERNRDAVRSREAILEAAESAFSERGFDGASLSDIGALAGLSRETPGYFFGSKERLYLAVLERVFAARQEATARAFEPVVTWCAGDASIKALDRALTEATHGYMGFLLDREAFVRLLVWEELAGGWRLRSASRTSTAIHDAFGALRSIGNRRGLRSFDVDDAVLLFVSLAFAPLAHRSTLMAALGRDLAEPRARRRHVRFVVAQLMHLLTGT